MADVRKVISAFTLGEVSQDILGRVDLPGYHNSCEQLKNWFVKAMGGIEQRPGTIYVANTNNNAKTRLYPFIRKDGSAYILAMQTDRMDYFKDGAQLATNDTITPAWAESEFPEIQVLQEDDSYYFVHAEKQAQKLIYTSDLVWAIAVHAWTSVTYAPVDDRARAIALYQRRLILGSTNNAPTTMRGSVPSSFDDMTAATGQWTYGQGGIRIMWVAGWTHLLVGTALGEFSWGPNIIDNSAAIPNIQQVAGHGSELRQPIFAQGRLLFIQRGGVVVREMLFSDEQRGFNAKHLNELADHILGTTAMVDWAYQQAPRPTVWVVRGDGKIAALSYDVANEILAWSTIETDGEFESVAVIPNGVEDQVWVVVKRTINGATERHVEYFYVRNVTLKTDVYHMDSGVRIDNGPAKNISNITQADPAVMTHDGGSADTNFANGEVIHIKGVVGMVEANTTNDGHYQVANAGGGSGAWTVELKTPDGTTNIDSTGWGTYAAGPDTAQKKQKVVTGATHLEGKTVTIMSEGGQHTQQTVVSGSFTLDQFANKIAYGLGYDADMKPTGLDTLESMARVRSIDTLHVRVKDTNTLQIGPNADNLETIDFRGAEAPTDEGPDPFTGTKEKSIAKFLSRRGRLLIRAPADSPLGCKIMSLTAEAEAGD